VLHVRRLEPGERTAVPDAPRVYVHVARGAVRLAGQELGPGDAARITGAEGLRALASAPADLLLWELTP
jgi:redox-sensitive bicupin YhaK (pirin superfamily)